MYQYLYFDGFPLGTLCLDINSLICAVFEFINTCTSACIPEPCIYNIKKSPS